jgi:hypothetical protein
MRMSIVSLALLLPATLLTGCTSTTLRVSGTPGARYRGRYSFVGYESTPAEVSGKLPYLDQNIAPYWGWRYFRVAECEFFKEDTNTVMRLELREHRFHVALDSPPGASGLRLTWNGSGYDSDVLR